MMSMPNSVAPPPPADPATEREDFDAAPQPTSTTPLALGAIAGVAAVVMLAIALIGGGAGHHATGAMTMRMSPAGIAPVAQQPASTRLPAATPTIRLSVAGANKLGPDGKMHDSFSTTNFAVRVGQPTVLRITNADDVPHSITATATGVSITVLPGTHSYTLVATKAGRFEWVCVIPCDSDSAGWAMTHPGYMAGYITAT
jgi:uncharacterized cupredoxin-like copper-binding protein